MKPIGKCTLADPPLTAAVLLAARIRHSTFLVILSLALTGLAGCYSIGPRAIPRDRFNYSAALADSWKTQMLLNIIKARYLDLQIYLDVGQIVSGYTLETTANIGGGWFAQAPGSLGNNLTLGGSARFADTPTITYTPLTGEKFLEGYLAPVDPTKVLSLLQAGYAADFILELCVDSLNGLRNRPVIPGSKRQADPEFFRVLALLREMQDAVALGLRVERPKGGEPATVLFFRSDRVEPEMQAKMTEVRDLLGLTPGQSVFKIVSSPVRGGDGELTLGTRSLSQMISALALGVEVPTAHLERKLTPPFPGIPAGEEALLRIHSGPEEPAAAFQAERYEGQWFWIANDDWRSKRTFSSILFLFTLANTGPSPNVPTLTIPTR